MTLVQFQVFLTVCETKSFTRAGEVLSMTQSAVSQAVAGLEAELGVTLLNRSRHGITLTHIGERMLKHVREIIRHTQCMKDEANAASGLDTGTLRIAAIPSVTAKLLPGLLGSFRRRFPTVQTVLFEGSYDEVGGWVNDHVVDVGFLTIPATGDFDVIPLVQDELLLFVPSNHPLHEETHIAIDQLEDDPFILSKADSESAVRAVLQKHEKAPQILFEVRDTATILAMVQEGIGVTMLPEMAIPTSLPNVKSAHIKPPATRTVALGVRKLDAVSPMVAEFLLHTKEYVKEFCPDCESV